MCQGKNKTTTPHARFSVLAQQSESSDSEDERDQQLEEEPPAKLLRAGSSGGWETVTKKEAKPKPKPVKIGQYARLAKPLCPAHKASVSDAQGVCVLSLQGPNRYSRFQLYVTGAFGLDEAKLTKLFEQFGEINEAVDLAKAFPGVAFVKYARVVQRIEWSIECLVHRMFDSTGTVRVPQPVQRWRRARSGTTGRRSPWSTWT